MMQSKNKYHHDMNSSAMDRAKINFNYSQVAKVFGLTPSTARRWMIRLYEENANVKIHSTATHNVITKSGISVTAKMTFYYFDDIATAIVGNFKRRGYLYIKKVHKFYENIGPKTQFENERLKDFFTKNQIIAKRQKIYLEANIFSGISSYQILGKRLPLDCELISEISTKRFDLRKKIKIYEACHEYELKERDIKNKKENFLKKTTQQEKNYWETVLVNSKKDVKANAKQLDDFYEKAMAKLFDGVKKREERANKRRIERDNKNR